MWKQNTMNYFILFVFSNFLEINALDYISCLFENQITTTTRKVFKAIR